MKRTHFIKVLTATTLITLILIFLWLLIPPPPAVYADTIYVSGTISSNTNWTADNLYVVQGDVTIASSVVLTIEPSVVVKFQENSRLIVNGVLDAQGTNADQIVFTSFKDDDHGGDTNGDGTATAAAPNDWGWIEFGSASVDSQNILDYCTILYGGKDNWSYSDRFFGAVNLIGASPTISRCTISNNGNYAVSMDTNSFPTVTENTLTDNGTNGIGVYGGTISTNAAWTSTYHPYVVDADITIASGTTFTIDPGVIVKGRNNTRLIVNGVLNAQGTDANRVVFTSIKDDDHGGDTNGDGAASVAAANDWGWIEFGSASVDSQNILDYCTILYGGKDNWSYSDRFFGAVNLIGASPTISRCTISNNGNYAVSMDTNSFPTVTENTLTDNGTNGIGVYGGTISTNGAWTSTYHPYVLDADITVASGAKFTIDPGVIVKGRNNTRLIVNGVLDAQGTDVNPIVFTSIKDDDHGGDTNGDGAASAAAPNDWGWIEFGSASVDSQNILDYCTILYGGKDNWSYSDRFFGAVNLIGASPTISRCTISNNSNYAVSMDTNSFPTVIDNTFTDNGTNGIGVYGGTISTNAAWTSTYHPYVLDSDITIASGATFTIDPGVIVKGRNNTRLIVNGVLNAQGTDANRVVFTSIKDDDHGGDTNGDGAASAAAPNDWGWIEFGSASVDSQNILDYCTILYGGKDNWSYSDRYFGAVRLVEASPTISRCTISNNSTYALGMDTNSFPTVIDNTFTDNGTNGIGVYGGTISTNGAWTSTNYPYVLDNADVIVGAGTSLSIGPGVVIKVKGNPRLIVSGILDAVGTAANPIHITSIKDDLVAGDTNGDGGGSSAAPGDWKHILFENPGGHSILEYIVIRYGGKSGYMVYSNGAYLTVQHALLEHSSGHGLYIYHETTDPAVTVQYSTFRLNAWSGVRVEGS